VSFFAQTEAQQPAQKRKLLNISDDALNSNQQSVPVKYLAGRAYIAGDFISPAYNPRAVPIKTSTGKGDSTTTDYKYYADFAMVFCMGGRRPVDALYTIVVDSDIVWTGNVQRGSAQKEVITIDKYGTIHLYWGSDTQGIDAILLTPRTAGAGDPLDSTTWDPNSGGSIFNGFAAGDLNPYSGHYDQHPAYRGQCYAVFKDWKLGRGRTNIPNIMFELKRGCPWLAGGQIDSDDQGINPAAIIYDHLTDPRFGMEVPESKLLNFQTAFNGLGALGAKLSVVISEQTQFRQFIAQILEYFDGWIRRNGQKIELGFWSHGTPTITVQLTDDDLLGNPELNPQGWSDTLNEVTVVYNDRDHHFNTYSQTARDPNNRRITGGPRAVTLQRSWLTDAALAKQYATEYCKVKALPTMAGQLPVKREWLEHNGMLPGKLFTYDSAWYGWSIAMRLLEIEYPSDNSSKAILTVSWETAIWPSIYIPPPFQGPGGFVLGPRGIWQSRVTEVPYLLQDHRFLTQIACLAVKGNVETIGYRIWASFDGGATYQDLSNTNDFAAFGRLNLPMISSSVAFWATLYGAGQDQVVTQTPGQQSDDTYLAFIDGEVLSVGIVAAHGSGTVEVFILRGRLGTVAEAHAVNAPIYFIPRSALHILDNAGFIPGTVVKFKLQPFTEDQDYDLAAVTPVSYTVLGFDELPAPILNPPATSFRFSLWVYVHGLAGTTIRYTADGTGVTPDSAIFPFNGLLLSATTTLRLRAYAIGGRRSEELMATYTKTSDTEIPPAGACAPPMRSFSGSNHQTTGNLTLTATTAGSAIKYKKNDGPTLTYTSPIFCACVSGGDLIEYWATKAGLTDSAHVIFDNSRIEIGGFGIPSGGLPPHLPP
jgi:hypothetical protein